ncbi:MAG: tail fiber domain-containing protein [Bacteroidales bacterium]|nr:tail fiber domain-containing protein [Bacteroidales bacterium]
MKKLTLSFVIILTTIALIAQSPQAFNYQAVVRDTNGAIVTNHTISLKIDILKDSISGAVAYSETHQATTNNFGLVNLTIGSGVILSGDFTAIDWSASKHFISTEVDINGGASYILSGVSQLLSVPYALHSLTSEDSYWKKNNKGIYYNGNVGIGSSAPGHKLEIKDTVSINKPYGTIFDVVGGNTSGQRFRGVSCRLHGTNGTNRAFEAHSHGLSDGVNTGVYGIADSGAFNVAVGGFVDYYDTVGYNYAVNASARSSELANISVGAYSEWGDSTAGDNYGVSARASSITSGTNLGIYSEALNGGTNYAGFFNGDVTVIGTFANPSDIMLKSDINPINSALSIIENLIPVTYYNKPDEKFKSLNLPDNLQYGFIAQDMEKILPELVRKQILPGSSKGSSEYIIAKLDENLEFKGINYIGIIPILTKGIKEQQNIIEGLEQRLLKLEERISKLEK